VVVIVGLATSIIGLCVLVGKESSEKFLVPIVLQLFKDLCPMVRVRLVNKIEDMVTVCTKRSWTDLFVSGWVLLIFLLELDRHCVQDTNS